MLNLSTMLLTFLQNIKAYGEMKFCQQNRFSNTVSIFRQSKSIKDDPNSRRPSTLRTEDNVDRISYLVWSNCRLTIRIIPQKLNLNNTTIHQILTNELEMRKVCVKLVLNRKTTGQIENDPGFLKKSYYWLIT